METISFARANLPKVIINESVQDALTWKWTGDERKEQSTVFIILSVKSFPFSQRVHGSRIRSMKSASFVSNPFEKNGPFLNHNENCIDRMYQNILNGPNIYFLIDKKDQSVDDPPRFSFSVTLGPPMQAAI